MLQSMFVSKLLTVMVLGSMDLGTDYCYRGAPLALFWSLTLGCYRYISGIRCLLSAGIPSDRRRGGAVRSGRW